MIYSPKKYLPFLMWFFPLSFFAFQFMLRLWPGLMMQEIMTHFAIDAGSFGLLAAFYYYGYAGMQIPMAFLLEKFGARTVVFTFALLCGMGALMFSYTDNFYLALLSRLMIGAGSAVGFLGISKVVSEWFSSENYAKMIGFSFSVGLMGAVYGGKPLTQWIQTYNGQQVGFALALIAMTIGLCTYWVVRSPRVQTKKPAQELQLSHLSALFSSWIIWTLAFANLLMVGALEGFADVWGVPYLMTAYNFDKAEAASLVSFIYIGMIFGGPVLAFLSKKIGNYSVIGMCGVGLALAFMLLISNSMMNSWLLSLLFFTIGLMCCYQVIVFAAGSTLVSYKQLGITVAFLNCINMLGGSFFHTLIGKVMDWYWEGSFNPEGMRQYSVECFQHALTVIPVCALFGSLLIYLIHVQVKNRMVTKSVDLDSLSGA
ncbi:MFS transporter [Legionella quateirensis]|uniref:Lysosomal dipeptide transporter MFSD1 n=1 Tax=Legionella quateirensis TaxID=45072 RepID=A0A378KQU4_9GAMM|nr:MFS transporter [Legionella quateirensis]KTD54752.1 major facilitator family transporter [Legionella quateirensis]STY16932.1 major facilitator family transporter [Legionella quateirensis]